MSRDTDDQNAPLSQREEEASVDEAITQELAHEERRSADAKQGAIERETRERHLDEG